MRLLFVGDPHAEAHDLADVEALGAYVLDLAVQHQAVLVLAGDLYHNHAIVHLDVQYFWWTFFEAVRECGIQAIVLKGNHDASGTVGSRATSLIAHVEQCTTVLYEPFVFNGVLFCPYTTGPQLVEWSKAYPECRTLICHATFNGSHYENGFYAGDGVEPEAIAQEQVLSGHIHCPQEFGKIAYIGAPRWRTQSDANIDRAVWLLEIDETGWIVSRTAFPTDVVCRKIFHLIDTPEAPLHIEPITRHQYRIDSKGPAAWLETRKDLFVWAKWRGIKTDGRAVRVRESEGVGTAFKKWMTEFRPRYGTSQVVLNDLVKERLDNEFLG